MSGSLAQSRDPALRAGQLLEARIREVMVGTSSLDLQCRAVVRITADVKVVGHDRVLTTPVTALPDPERG